MTRLSVAHSLTWGCLAVWISASGYMPAQAQSIPERPMELRGPLLGFVYDADQMQLRRVTGLPGAAGWDDVVPLDASWRVLALAPRRTYALAGTDGGISLLTWDRAGTRAIPLPDAITPTATVFSPRGAAALLYDRSEQALQVWTGFPDQPTLARRLSAGSPLAALAVSDDGSAVLAIDGDSLRVWTEEPESGRILVSGAEYRMVQFRPGSHDAAYADAHAVTLVHDVRSAAGTVALADSLTDPVALAFSADGRKLLVADREPDRVVVVDLAQGSSIDLSCERTPDGLWPLEGNARFALTTQAKKGLLLLDADSTGATLFTAAAPTLSGARQ